MVKKHFEKCLLLEVNRNSRFRKLLNHSQLSASTNTTRTVNGSSKFFKTLSCRVLNYNFFQSRAQNGLQKRLKLFKNYEA